MQHAQRVEIVHAARDVHQAQVDDGLHKKGNQPASPPDARL